MGLCWIGWRSGKQELSKTRNGNSNSGDSSRKASVGLVNLPGFLRLSVEKRFGYAVESRAAASLYVWFGRFRGVRGFLVEIANGELLDSEIVEEGEDVCEVPVHVDGDLTKSKSNPMVLPLAPLKHEDI